MHSLLSPLRHANNGELSCLQSLPFSKFGSDYAGPFKVRLTKFRRKGIIGSWPEDVIAPISTVIKRKISLVLTKSYEHFR